MPVNEKARKGVRMLVGVTDPDDHKERGFYSTVRGRSTSGTQGMPWGVSQGFLHPVAVKGPFVQPSPRKAQSSWRRSLGTSSLDSPKCLLR